MFRSSQILLVSFDPSTGLDPLTVVAKRLAEQVESYLQRVTPGELVVDVADDEDRGLVLRAGRLVAAFSFAPLGVAQ